MLFIHFLNGIFWSPIFLNLPMSDLLFYFATYVLMLFLFPCIYMWILGWACQFLLKLYLAFWWRLYRIYRSSRLTLCGCFGHQIACFDSASLIPENSVINLILNRNHLILMVEIKWRFFSWLVFTYIKCGQQMWPSPRVMKNTGEPVQSPIRSPRIFVSRLILHVLSELTFHCFLRHDPKVHEHMYHSDS